jgi:hypothetical protein
VQKAVARATVAQVYGACDHGVSTGKAHDLLQAWSSSASERIEFALRRELPSQV